MARCSRWWVVRTGARGDSRCGDDGGWAGRWRKDLRPGKHLLGMWGAPVVAGVLLVIVMIFIGMVYLIPVMEWIRDAREQSKKRKQKAAADAERWVRLNQPMSNYQNPPDWHDRRNYVLDRDHHRCTRCGSKTNLHVHHIVHRAERLDHNVGNLQTLCNRCHGDEHGKKLAPTDRYWAWLAEDGREITARKPHKCNGCGELIKKGESYFHITRGNHRVQMRVDYPGGARICRRCATRR